jgi:carbamoyl-phosphate synthase large subunit
MRIMVEACGCVTCGATINAIHEAGHVCVATDASEEAVGRWLADEFYRVPFARDEEFTRFIRSFVIEKNIDIVFPSLDDALLKWAHLKPELEKSGVHVMQSDMDTINICCDKWKLYNKFLENSIPTPKTSLCQDYPLVKPRNGRGGEGVAVTDKPIPMANMISQELLQGVEYTVDVFCNCLYEPVYIVPRVRMGVKDGKSTAGIVLDKPQIVEWTKKICSVIHFTGPVNIQCFETNEGIKFTEINPRFGGGTALGMAATENWIPLIVDTIIRHIPVIAKKDIKYGLKMGRYYAEVFCY